MLDTIIPDREPLVYIQKLNPVTGSNTWEPQPETYDYHREVARSSYADMLHDTERNRKYYEAIKQAIDTIRSQGRTASVLDIGTGTGLLSMMAARSGADAVFACEAFSPMAECAKDIIKLNGLEDKIQIIPKRSTELKVGPNGDLKSKCNILVTEVFDTELIGEGAFQTFDHALKDLLEKDPIVVPTSATIYAQVVESPLVYNWNRLKDVYDDEGELMLTVPPSVKTCPGAASVHDLQLSQVDTKDFNTIVPPKPVLHFDWSGKESLSYKRNVVLDVKAEQDGVAQAVFMWWELNMDGEGKNVLSCAPVWAHPSGIEQIPWRDHWMQAIYYLPKEVKVTKDQSLALICCHDEYSLWFNLKSTRLVWDNEYGRPLCDCNLHMAHSRTRIGQLNDCTRRKKYQAVYDKHVDEDSIVLMLGNGFYSSLTAAKKAKKLVYVDDSYLSRSILQQFITQNSIGNVEVFEDMTEFKSKFDVSTVDLVISDEHFKTSLLPWDNLVFAYQIKEITDLLKEDVKIIPRVATIKAMAVEFVDLHKIRAPVQNCEGFLMTPFDRLIENSSGISDDAVEAQPLWEYPCFAKSEATSLSDISAELIVSGENLETKGTITLQGDRKYNGVAVWVEWDLDGSGANRISTGPITAPQIGEKVQWDMHVRQGVYILANKREESFCPFHFKFDVRNGDITFRFR